MRQRRWWLRYWLTAGGTFAVARAVIYFALPSRSGVSLENANRIRGGMSVEEVVAIMGEQPAGVTHEETTVGRKTLMWWSGVRYDITVCIVQGNGVLYVTPVRQPSWAERFWRWIVT